MIFGLTPLELIIGAAILIVGLAWVAKRTPSVQQKLLDVLPDAGDRALLALQQHIPDDAELRDKARAALDAADAKAEKLAVDFLKKRGLTVTKDGAPL